MNQRTLNLRSSFMSRARSNLSNNNVRCAAALLKRSLNTCKIIQIININLK